MFMDTMAIPLHHCLTLFSYPSIQLQLQITYKNFSLFPHSSLMIPHTPCCIGPNRILTRDIYSTHISCNIFHASNHSNQLQKFNSNNEISLDRHIHVCGCWRCIVRLVSTSATATAISRSSTQNTAVSQEGHFINNS